MRLASITLLAAVSLFAQAPTVINPGSPVASAVVNANFQGLYNGRVGRWSGNGAPGDFPFSLIGDIYFDRTSPGSTYGCYQLHCTAVGTNNWVLISTGGSGTCAGLVGDVTGACNANTVVKVNNAPVPTSAAALGSDPNGALIAVTPSGTTPGYPANQTTSGCGVEYTSGLSFTVGACSYTIAGSAYASPLTNKTLAAADPSNPRIDVIGVDNTSAVFVITGTPGATPQQPTIDPSTQLGLTFVLVPAGGTTPTGIVSTLLYDENVEWTCASTAHINCASTSNPYHGTKDIEATAAVLGNNFTLVKPASGTVDLSTQNTLIFYIRSKAAWPKGAGTGATGARTLSLFWLNGATQVGNQIVINDGAFGFSSANTTNYQQIAIPISLFGAGANVATTLKAQVTGNGGTSSFGWYIDQVTLQSGAGAFSLPVTLMNFKGTWNSSASYAVNDTVVSGGIGYVALKANTNVAVSNLPTWASLANSASGNTLTTVGFSATPTFTRTTANQEWVITLTGNVTSSTLSGASAGDILVFNIIQDGTGNRTFAWPTGFSEACTIAATANIGTKQAFYWDGAAAHAITPCVTTAATSDLVLNDAVNTFTAAGTLDLSASTVANALRAPVAAGATATANGAIAYDSTNNMLHAAQGAGDAMVPQFTAIPANNDCTKWVVSGSNYKLGTQGASCVPAAQTYRTCVISNDTQSGTALTAAQFSGNGCVIPAASTIVEVDVTGGTGTVNGTPAAPTYSGTSSVQIGKTGASSSTGLLSGALATVSGKACAKSTISQACILNGVTSSGSITVSTTALAAGDEIYVTAATPDTAQTWYSVTVIYTVN